MAKKRWISEGKIAIIIAFSALCFSAYTYYETTRPHTQFEEIEKKLDRTLNFLNETEGIINKRENLGENVIESKEMLQDARVLYLNAENAWIHRNYDKANEFLENSYEIILEVRMPLPPVIPQPVFIVMFALMVMVMIMAVIAIFLKKYKKTFHHFDHSKGKPRTQAGRLMSFFRTQPRECYLKKYD